MKGFRLNGWQLGIIAAALAVCVAGVFAYLDYRRFEAETRGYLGVTFADTHEVVLYRLGEPERVVDDVDDSNAVLGGSSGPLLIRRGADIPEGKRIEDYDLWIYS